MEKPASLRSAIKAAIPELRNEPDRLAIWIENGAVRATQTETKGFAFEYPLSVLLTEVSTDIAIITLAITRWLYVNQPDLLVPGKDSFAFETDVMDNQTSDILFTLRLTENVAVSPKEDGGFDVEYLAEPDPLFDDGEGAGETDPVPPLVSVDTIVSDD